VLEEKRAELGVDGRHRREAEMVVDSLEGDATRGEGGEDGPESHLRSLPRLCRRQKGY
jgi:hypothetical protein